MQLYMYCIGIRFYSMRPNNFFDVKINKYTPVVAKSQRVFYIHVSPNSFKHFHVLLSNITLFWRKKRPTLVILNVHKE
jgi:hypothetical protein